MGVITPVSTSGGLEEYERVEGDGDAVSEQAPLSLARWSSVQTVLEDTIGVSRGTLTSHYRVGRDQQDLLEATQEEGVRKAKLKRKPTVRMASRRVSPSTRNKRAAACTELLHACSGQQWATTTSMTG